MCGDCSWEKLKTLKGKTIILYRHNGEKEIGVVSYFGHLRSPMGELAESVGLMAPPTGSPIVAGTGVVVGMGCEIPEYCVLGYKVLN